MPQIQNDVDGANKLHPRLFLSRVPAVLICLVWISTACQPQKSTVTLAFLGDVMVGRSVKPQFSSMAFLEPDLNKADLVLANLESPFTVNPPDSDSPYNLCAPADHASILSSWGLNLLTLANNHANDCSPDGITETRFILEEAGIKSLDPQNQPLFFYLNNLNLAFFAFDDVSAPMDIPAAVNAIQTAHRTGATVIVSMHWGYEYQTGASQRQETIAQALAGAGAALIWGHHPHVLQPARWITVDERKTLVFYSLGNALFDQTGLEETRESVLVLVTLDSEGIHSVESIPFAMDIYHSLIVPADENSEARIFERLNLP